MPFINTPCECCDNLTAEPPVLGPCTAYVEGINACCRISGQPVAECGDLSCLVIRASINFVQIGGVDCPDFDFPACLTWDSGLTFTGTNADETVDWEITLVKEGECTPTTNAFYYVESGTMTGYGFSVSFERDEETGLLEVTIVDDTAECGATIIENGACSELSFVGSWHIGYHEDDLPLTMNLAIGGLVAVALGDHCDADAAAAVALLNDSHSIELVSSTVDACGYVTAATYSTDGTLDCTMGSGNCDKVCVNYTVTRGSGCKASGTLNFSACAEGANPLCAFAVVGCSSVGSWCGCAINYDALTPAENPTSFACTNGFVNSSGMTLSGDL